MSLSTGLFAWIPFGCRSQEDNRLRMDPVTLPVQVHDRRAAVGLYLVQPRALLMEQGGL